MAPPQFRSSLHFRRLYLTPISPVPRLSVALPSSIAPSSIKNRLGADPSLTEVSSSQLGFPLITPTRYYGGRQAIHSLEAPRVRTALHVSSLLRTSTQVG